MTESTLQNSPPEAYGSVYSQEVIDHGTQYLNDPYSYETPEQAHQRAIDTINNIADGKRSGFAKETLEIESRLLGISPKTHGAEKFLEAHLDFMHEMNEHFKNQFDHYMELIPTMVAEEIADSPEESQKLEDSMKERLVNQWFSITDIYRSEFSEEPAAKGVLGANNRSSKEITLFSSSIINLLSDPDKKTQDIDREFEKVAQHEPFHGIFGTWYDTERMFTGIVSNGLKVTDPEDDHGEWLNEATIEKYRSRKFKTGTFSYEAGVLALSIADAINPDFERQRLRTAVTNEGRGQVVGELENIFGPLAVETIEDAINTVSEVADLPNYKKQLLALLDEDKQETASQAFDALAIPLVERIKAGIN